MPFATYPTRSSPVAHMYADHDHGRHHDRDPNSRVPPPPPHIWRPSSPGSPPVIFSHFTTDYASPSSASPTSPPPFMAAADRESDPSPVQSGRTTSSSSVSSNQPKSSLLATSARLTYLSALFATVLCALLNLVLASYVVKLARDAQRMAKSTRVSVRKAKMLVDLWSRKWRMVRVVKRVVPWPVLWVVGMVVKQSQSRVARTTGGAAARAPGVKKG
ncbi:hypothetical protein BCR44DRAFT_35125, partial [Catenaria anguillulae PL171]